ncbi:ABC transporter permease [Ravibacter arvi]|uniref:ABC transporter permease n=2 Tax=Ravibacter arvi TaxID=2051041 RepID=A0ABP8M8W7_9BACT
MFIFTFFNTMLTNYFKLTWRNLKSNRIFSILNIVGLAVGIACACLIFLWIEYYVDFNHSISNLDNLYNVKNNQTYGKDIYTFSSTPFKAKAALENGVTGIRQVARYNGSNAALAVGDNIQAQNGAYVDSTFMSMFGFAMVTGNAGTALNDKSRIAISEKLVKVYFPDGDPLDKTILVNNNPYTVSAVFRQRSGNVSFNNLDWLLPYEVFYGPHRDKPEDSWGNNWTDTWVLTDPGVNLEKVNAEVRKLVERETAGTVDNILFLYPLKRMTLYGGFTNGEEAPAIGQIRYIRMFAFIAGIILLVACINFMNLSTARSEKRSREIGIRKVLGSQRKELVSKFLFESVFISYVAVFLALVLVLATLPFFNKLIGVELTSGLSKTSHWLFLLLIGLFSGILAGSYPSLYLSSFNPVSVLKGHFAKDRAGVLNIRRSLVVVQFAVSVTIIVAVILVYQQISFTRKRELGYSKDNILYVATTEAIKKNPESLKQALLNTGAVSSASFSNASPMAMYSNGGGFRWKGKNEGEEILVTLVAADHDFQKTFGIKLKEGRLFSNRPEPDSNNVVINETFSRIMGAGGQLGATITQGDGGPLTIIGIVDDFVFNNINRAKPEPLLFFNLPQYAETVYMKLKPTGDLQRDIRKIEAAFKEIDSTTPFDYHFVDADFEAKFWQVKFLGSLAVVFGSLAILISCLGLFGLSAFMAEKRTREVGVRKVLGASVNSLTFLLTKDFLKLVLVACLVAFPLAYWLMDGWLRDYEYRVDISWTVFLIAGAGAMLIAFLTVSLQTIKAAMANPVNSLRAE